MLGAEALKDRFFAVGEGEAQFTHLILVESPHVRSEPVQPATPLCAWALECSALS